MIAVKIFSGLGNQLFQYAAGRVLANRLDTHLYLDIEDFKKNNYRKFYLNQFKLNAFLLSTFRKNLFPIRLSRFPSLYNHFENYLPFKYYYSTYNSFDPNLAGIRNNTYIDGYFQSIQYALEIENELQSPCFFTPLINLNFPKHVFDSEIAVHIRGTDYLGNEMFHKLDDKYYYDSLDLLYQQKPFTKIYLFTDDLIYAKSLLKKYKKSEIIYISESTLGDFYTLQQFRRIIISNSTFAWWAAFLSTKNNKVVLCPEYWFNGIRSDNIVHPDWIRIPN